MTDFLRRSLTSTIRSTTPAFLGAFVIGLPIVFESNIVQEPDHPILAQMAELVRIDRVLIARVVSNLVYFRSLNILIPRLCIVLNLRDTDSPRNT